MTSATRKITRVLPPTELFDTSVGVAADAGGRAATGEPTTRTFEGWFADADVLDSGDPELMDFCTGCAALGGAG